MRKKRYIIIEIIALCFLSIIVAVSILFGFHQKLSAQKVYHAVFHDVDGLIVGSPVRLMGVDIGHVKNLKNLYDDVHLTFVITRKDIDIPKGTVATIQFTGLAGSKSLELLPSIPCAVGDCPIATIEPIRINTVFSIQNAMTESLVGYSRSISNIVGQKPSNEAHELIHSTIKKTMEIGEGFDNINNGLFDKNNQIKELSKGAKNAIETGIFALGFADELVENSPKTIDTAKDFNDFIKENLNDKNIDQITNKLYGVRSSLEKINEKEFYEKIYKFSDDANKNINDATNFMNSLMERLSGQELKKLRSSIKELRTQAEEMNKQD